MIIGYSSNRIQQEVLDKMNAMPIKFFLTGSRFFGYNDMHSDYDFFIQDVLNCASNLKKIGFVDISNKKLNAGTVMSYDDRLTVAVYRHEEAQIDIQIVSDAKMKFMVQSFICQTPAYLEQLISLRKKGEKTEAKHIWNMALSTIELVFRIDNAVSMIV